MPRRVTPAQRRYAEELDAERSKLESLGHRAAVRNAVTLRHEVVTTYRRGGNVDRVIEQHVQSMRGLLVDAMTAAHMLGKRRVRLNARRARRKLKLSIYDDAIEFLTRQLAMSDDEVRALSEQYGPEVERVLNRLRADLVQRVHGAIADTARQGLHVRAGIEHIRRTLAAAGITPEKDHVLEQIFRTQTQMAYSAGRWNELRSQDIDEILWGFKYVSVGDDRVRPAHAALDGVTLPKDHPFWRRAFPPNGFNCRCGVIELFDEEDIVEPPGMAEVDGAQVVPGPDRGFEFNPGEMFREMRHPSLV